LRINIRGQDAYAQKVTTLVSKEDIGDYANDTS